MKKISCLLFAFILSFAAVSSCFAAEFENPPVIDDAGFLTESQLEELSQRLEEVRQKYNFEVAIVTEEEMSGVDPMQTADDIYDYSGFGGGEHDDGILFYISENPREYWFTTHAYGLVVFNDRGIAYLKDNVQPYLSEGNYYLAMETYINIADEFLQMAENGEPFNEKQYSMTYILIVLGCGLLLPLLIAFLCMSSKLSKMKTAVENDYAANYIKDGSKRLDFARDIFLYSNITKTEKPKNNSSSHTSSSGRTHGGGGGSY